MSDILVLVVIALLPATLVVGPLAVLTLGLAGVADLDGNGLLRSTGQAPAAVSPRPGR
jgi:hypothetical protein